MNLSTDSRHHADNYGTQEWRQPTILPGDEVLYSEPGRIMRGVDYRSHCFRIVRPRFGQVTLCVKHGGGEERIPLDYHAESVCAIFNPLSSDDRYFLMRTFLELAHRVRREAIQETADLYRKAFVDGRLKKRKRPGINAYVVTLEQESARG